MITNVGDMEKREFLHVVGGNIYSAATAETSLEVSQNPRNRSTVRPRYTAPGNRSKGLFMPIHVCKARKWNPIT